MPVDSSPPHDNNQIATYDKSFFVAWAFVLVAKRAFAFLSFVSYSHHPLFLIACIRRQELDIFLGISQRNNEKILHQ